MRISSNSYDYYNLVYSSGILTNSTATNTSTDSSEMKTEESTSSGIKKYYMNDIDSSAMDLSYTARMIAHSLQMTDENSIETSSNNFGDTSTSKDIIKEDMDAIKTADIDSLSADEMKELLENLKNDMESAAGPYKQRGSRPQMDLDNMSESDMREMLKKIQERANKGPVHNKDEEINMKSNIKEDIDSIKNTDIDSLSSEEVKELLTKLNDDIKAMHKPIGPPPEDISGDKGSGETDYIDIDSMSESDMRDLLKQIQEQMGSESSEALTA